MADSRPVFIFDLDDTLYDRAVPQHRPEFTVCSVKEMFQAVKKISGLPDPVG